MLTSSGRTVQLGWSELKELEGQLGDIEVMASVHRHLPDREFWRTFEVLKERLKGIVGWNASNPILRTQEAYAAAIDAILTAMSPRTSMLTCYELEVPRSMAA